jgi:hypothetical protein
MKKISAVLALAALIFGIIMLIEAGAQQGDHHPIPQSCRKVSRPCLPQLVTAVINPAKSSVERTRLSMADRIDARLAGTPLSGQGMTFVLAAEPYSIDPRLMVGLAGHESSFGELCFARRNPFGMMQYREGFACWEDAIYANAEWLHRYYGSPQTAYNCPEYCEGTPSSWLNGVEAIRESI